MRVELGTRWSHLVADAQPLGTIIAGWKPGSPGVVAWRDFPHWVLVLTSGGGAVFEDEAGRRERLAPGDVLCLFPGVKHRFIPNVGRAWDEFFLIFSGSTFAPWMAPRLLSPQRPVLRLGAAGYWLRRFAGVVDGSTGFAAVARLHQVIADLVAAVERAGDDDDRAWLARARDLLGDVERPAISARAMARRLGCSPQVFRKRFRLLAGVAPGAYRDQARFEAACRLLRDARIAAVAQRLGFHDAFHFSRRFSQRFGVSPSAFQRVIADRVPPT